MRELILYSILTFFSIYGFISLVLFIFDFIFESLYLKNKKVYIFFMVKNEACKIENIVKGLLFKLFKNDVGVSEQRLIVLDMESDDGTLNVLKKISESENSVLAFEKEEFSKKLTEL